MRSMFYTFKKFLNQCKAVLYPIALFLFKTITIMNRQFHHNKITNIVIGTIVYTTTIFIGACVIVLLHHVLNNPITQSFGIYG